MSDVVDLTGSGGSDSDDGDEATGAPPLPPRRDAFTALMRGPTTGSTSGPVRTLYCIRHAARQHYTTVDAELTHAGRRDAAALLSRSHAGVPLSTLLQGVRAVVVSPLTRTLQTAVLGFSTWRYRAELLLHAPLTGAAAAVPDDGGGAADVVRLYIAPLAREHVTTPCCEGRDRRPGAAAGGPPLPDELSHLAPHLHRLPRGWWREGMAAGARVEGAAEFARRVAAFRDQLRRLPAAFDRIVVVAHGDFLRELTGAPPLDYLGVATAVLRP
jgi:broad specificity phosphatase PhoE